MVNLTRGEGNLQKMNPIEIGICWEMVEPRLQVLLSYFPLVVNLPKKLNPLDT
jgi:hypothetical protein